MTSVQEIITIAIAALATMLMRFLPFAVFRSDKTTPKFLSYLGRMLPPAVFGMLVVYCLRDVSVTSYPFGIPELIAGAVVALLHIWKRNTLISIVSGTLLYMALVQFVFV